MFTDNSPQIEITGQVSNKAGEPLSGASVVVKRTKRGASTDAQGNFALRGIESSDSLVITFTGYAPKAIAVGDKGYVTIILEIADNMLDETIVQAYGTTTRRFATGNIARITAAEIERQPVMNPLLALQGRVAGLEINQLNGFASAPVKVELRGRKNRPAGICF